MQYRRNHQFIICLGRGAMTGNKKVSCTICYREMRSDNLTRHMKQHLSIQQTTEEICKDVVLEQVDKVVDMQSAPWTKRKFEDNDSNEDLKKEMVKDNNEYKRKIKLGKEVYKILGETDIEQGSLTLDRKEALDIYMTHKDDYFTDKVVQLKPWQESLLEYVQKPCDREIFWVVGKEGNEGKSWFQKYVKSWLGARRVVTGIDIKANNASIFQALRKCSIVTADIFLFNIGKSKKKFEVINYDALENMKDGEAFASKYDSQQLKIRVPNVVMVFSNSPPNISQLAKVRFEVFHIINDQLQKRNMVKNGNTNMEMPNQIMQNKNSDSDSDIDSQMSDY